MGIDYANVTLLGAVVRNPEPRLNANQTPFIDVSFAGEQPVSGFRGEAKTIPWYLTARFQGRWIEATKLLSAGAVAVVTGSLEQWVKHQETPNDLQSRIIPSRFEIIADYPSAMMLEDKTGGFRFAGGLNRVTLIGNLTRDPEHKKVEGQSVVKMAMAVNTAASREPKKVVFLNLDAWGDLSFRTKNLARGSRVLVMGNISMNRWKNAEGQSRSSLSVDVNDLERIDPISNGNSITRNPDPFFNDPILGFNP